MSYYARLIADYLASIKRQDIDPRHVEGYMRADHGTLDHLPGTQFHSAIRLAVREIDSGGGAAAEELARSYGLFPQRYESKEGT